MSHFTDNHSQWLDSAVPVPEQRPAQPLIGRDDPCTCKAPLPRWNDRLDREEHEPTCLNWKSEPSRVPIESQASVGLLLEAILHELRRINNTPREGAASSVLIEDNPTKDRIVRVTSKIYAGSVLDADEALRTHGYLHRRAEELALSGWQETIENLAAVKGLS